MSPSVSRFGACCWAPAPFAFLTTAAGGAFFLVCGSFFICKVSGSSRVRAEVRACKSHFFEGGSDPTVVLLLYWTTVQFTLWSCLAWFFFGYFVSCLLACLHSRLLDLGTRLFVL
jgi:hypothetical protein